MCNFALPLAALLLSTATACSGGSSPTTADLRAPQDLRAAAPDLAGGLPFSCNPFGSCAPAAQQPGYCQHCTSDSQCDKATLCPQASGPGRCVVPDGGAAPYCQWPL